MFKIGDRAVLVSGGPEMEIIGVNRNGAVWCEWRQADGVIDEASFKPEMLRKVYHLAPTSDSGAKLSR
jgi:uncharacterized protein YodC (DUF2158 family)